MEIIIVLGVIALIIAFLVVQYNKLIRLNVAVDESFARAAVGKPRPAPPGQRGNNRCSESDQEFFLERGGDSHGFGVP